MTNSLVPTTVQWTPKERVWIKRGVSVAALAVVATVGAVVFNTVAPTWIEAIQLLQNLVANTTHFIIAVGIFAGVSFFLWDLFVPGGNLNKLVGQAYSSFINKATWALLDIDPLSPLYDQRREMESRKQIFDDAFQDFDGTIENLKQQETRYLEDAKRAESRARAAKKAVDGDPTMTTTFQQFAYEAGRCKEAAQQFATMRLRLEPVRNTIAKLREAVTVMLSNIDIDIRIAKDTWAAQQNMDKMNKSARGVLQRSKADLAAQAMDIINTKYAAQIGALENLKDITKPLLDSISLDKGTYSDELLVKWEAESREVLRLSPPSQSPMAMVGGAQTKQTSSSLAGLID